MIPLSKRVDIMEALAPRLRHRFRQLTDIAYGSEIEQAYDLYLPIQGDQNSPVLVFIPGGAWRRGNKNEYGFVGRRFAANGIITAVISYRLSPSARYPDFIMDAIEAVASVRAMAASINGTHAPLFVGGYSAGAYNAVQMTLGPELQAYDGLRIGDISGVVSISGIFNIGTLTGTYVTDAFGDYASSREVVPMNLVRRDVPPMLFITGDQDTNAHPSESVDLASALVEAGVASTVKIYRKSGHKRPICAVAYPILGKTVRDCILFMRQQRNTCPE